MGGTNLNNYCYYIFHILNTLSIICLIIICNFFLLIKRRKKSKHRKHAEIAKIAENKKTEKKTKTWTWKHPAWSLFPLICLPYSTHLPDCRSHCLFECRLSSHHAPYVHHVDFAFSRKPTMITTRIKLVTISSPQFH